MADLRKYFTIPVTKKKNEHNITFTFTNLQSSCFEFIPGVKHSLLYARTQLRERMSRDFKVSIARREVLAQPSTGLKLN